MLIRVKDNATARLLRALLNLCFHHAAFPGVGGLTLEFLVPFEAA